MQVLSYSQARNTLRGVLDQVIDNEDIALIHCRESDNAVLMSQRHYERLMETLHLNSTPANTRHLDASIQEYRAGKAKQRVLPTV